MYPLLLDNTNFQLPFKLSQTMSSPLDCSHISAAQRQQLNECQHFGSLAPRTQTLVLSQDILPSGKNKSLPYVTLVFLSNSKNCLNSKTNAKQSKSTVLPFNNELQHKFRNDGTAVGLNQNILPRPLVHRCCCCYLSHLPYPINIVTYFIKILTILKYYEGKNHNALDCGLCLTIMNIH